MDIETPVGIKAGQVCLRFKVRMRVFNADGLYHCHVREYHASKMELREKGQAEMSEGQDAILVDSLQRNADI